MYSPTRYAVLGGHEVESGWYDALDVLLADADDVIVVFGMRTAGHVETVRRGDAGEWSGAHPALPITLDLNARRFWDFDQVLWLGPDAWPCLVWSNARAFASSAIRTTFGRRRSESLLRGPHGSGLPTPGQVGVEVPATLEWMPLDRSSAL